MKNLLTYAEYSAASAITQGAKLSGKGASKSRAEETPKEETSKPVTKLDYYTEALIALIPSPIIGAYVVIDGIVKSSNLAEYRLNLVQWIVAGILLIFTPLYLRQVNKIDNIKQLIVSTLAFAVWIFALGGLFETSEDKSFLHLIGSITLVVFTLLTIIFANQIAKKQ